MGHMHLHSDSKPFKCLYCPSKFTLKGNLTRHMKVKHGVMERGLHSQGNHPSRPVSNKWELNLSLGSFTLGGYSYRHKREHNFQDHSGVAGGGWQCYYNKRKADI